MKATLKVGDLVTSDYHHQEKTVVRKITKIKPDKQYGSGYYASADGGEPCPHCGRPFGTEINYVDSAWFVLVEKAAK